ncbi:MAG: hypothetical protein KF764_13805 [Labilithrix sp.]|nr:hypothetical protein [Labilithrix sp.]MBX3224643.1 hypothetical protein [Labilithrix sp.]
MVKKIFALASVSALTGLVSAAAAAGCSSNEETKAGAADGAPPPTQVKDGGETPDRDRPGTGTRPGAECMETRDIDMTRVPYSRAKKTANACTTKELDDLSGFFRNKAQNAQDIVISDWAKVVSEGCASCVFSEGTGAEWAPILTKDNKLDDVNRGGCIEIASGKEACGRAYQHVAECRLEACSNTCDTAEGFTACLQDVQGIFSGPCKSAYDDLDKECGAKELPTYEAACKGNAFTFEGPIKVQCINGGVAK